MMNQKDNNGGNKINQRASLPSWLVLSIWSAGFIEQEIKGEVHQISEISKLLSGKDLFQPSHVWCNQER